MGFALTIHWQTKYAAIFLRNTKYKFNNAKENWRENIFSIVYPNEPFLNYNNRTEVNGLQGTLTSVFLVIHPFLYGYFEEKIPKLDLPFVCLRSTSTSNRWSNAILSHRLTGHMTRITCRNSDLSIRTLFRLLSWFVLVIRIFFHVHYT